MQKTLYHQFSNAAARYPEESCLSNGNLSLSYQNVLEKINVLSDNLAHQGYKPTQVIALYADKSIDAIMVFLALSKLGISCLTLDLAFPEKMIDWVLEDANVEAVIALKPLPITPRQPHYTWDDLTQATRAAEVQPYDNNYTAWLVYSSGTTGKPKGVSISSNAMVGSILARAEFSPYQAGETIACNIYFFWEAFRPLFFGATTMAVSDEILFDIAHYQQYLNTHAITETLWTPSFAEMLLSNLDQASLDAFNILKRVWLNGEVVSDMLAQSLTERLPDITFYNLYSISETFDVAARAISSNAMEGEFTSIGEPFSGVTCVILDETLKPCNPEQQGELYLTSPYLAEGYLNCPEDEAKSFVDLNGTRYFKTKDTAYQNQNREIFILGRNDHVVKLRGYNVSLLSIESTLKKVLPIKQCVVRLQGEENFSQVLVAELEPQDPNHFMKHYQLDTTGFSQALQSYLSEHLPSYAMPTRFVLNKQFKMNPYSAKLERKKQPERSEPLSLKTLWANILNVPENTLSDDNDFFALGANSLHVIQLLHALNKQFNTSITIPQLERHARLADLIRLTSEKTPQDEEDRLDLAAEIVFDLNIKTDSSAPHISCKTAKQVFVTGATGFLGAHWLSHTLKNTGATFYCLVRADSPNKALTRLKQSFNKYHLDTSLLDQRVEVICGDITETHLGINQEKWAWLTQHIDSIFHAAAYVNLLYPYSKLKPAIVEGARNVLTLAVTHHLKPTVVISSDAVFPETRTVSQSQFLEPNTIASLTYGYAQAKAIQEQLLKQLVEHYKLPFALFRLGNLAPSLSSGICNQEDLNRHLLTLIQQRGVCPESLYLEFTPVDRVVKTISQALSHSIQDSIITISQCNRLSATELQQYCPDWGLSILSDDEWQHVLATQAPLLASLSPIEALFKAKPYSIDTSDLKDCTLSDTDKQSILFTLAGIRHAETSL